MSENIEPKKKGRKPKEKIVDNTSVEVIPEIEESIENDTIIDEESTSLIPPITPAELEVMSKEEIIEVLSTDKIEDVVKIDEVATGEFKLPSTRKEIKNRIGEELPEVLQIKEDKELSLQAKRWKDYLLLQNISPETFAFKYPSHPSINFVKEVIEFKKNNP